MKKMVISLVIEGNEEDLNTIKGNVIDVACEAIISCSVNIIEEQPQELKIAKFMSCFGYGAYGDK